MQPFEHATAAAILLIAGIQAFADPEKFRQVPRSAFYRMGVATGVALTLGLMAAWSAADRPLDRFGLAGWTGSAPTAALAAAAAWPLLLVAAFRLCSGPFRGPVLRFYQGFEHLMPHRRAELGPARLAGALAGTGEEIAFRGYLIWYVTALAGSGAALLVSSVVFGLAHAYQGRKGIVFGTIAGLVLGTAYIATGSLLLVIWMHASYNVASFTLGYRLLGAPDR